MVELIVVIVIVGILSAFAAARFIDRKTADAPAYGQRLIALMRYGQKIAIAQNRPVYVLIAPNRAELCFDSDPGCSSHVSAPGGGNAGSVAGATACGNTEWYCEGTPAGISIVSPLALMSFDAQGRPYAGIDNPLTGASSFAGTSVTVNGGDAPLVVVIEPETGYVH